MSDYQGFGYFHHKIKRNTLLRFNAKLVDILLTGLFVAFIYPQGVFLGIFYLSCCDAMKGGKSFGKIIFGFETVSTVDSKPCRIKQSFLRNLPFIIPTFFSIIPYWGWVTASIFILCFSLAEIYMILCLSSGVRFGDVLARTQVLYKGRPVKD